MSSFSTLPTVIGLPSELSVNAIDAIVSPETKSNSIKVYAINNASVTGTFTTDNSNNNIASGINAEIPFPQNEINFDLPCSQSPDTWLDTRLSTISFRAIVTVTNAGTQQITSGTLRSSAYAYFDNMRLTGQSGNLLEYFNEYGLVSDLLIQSQVDDRESCFSYGLKSNFGQLNQAQVNSSSFTNTGHDIPVLSKGNVLVTGESLSFSYSVPLLSGVIGVLSDRFFPIGLTKKMLLTLTTASVLPFTIQLGTVGATGSTISVQLTDFALNLELIKVGTSAMSQIISTLPDNKMYIHGQTYKTTTTVLPANSSGSINLPVGLTGSSVRSLFARFHETGAPSALRSTHGKYDSKCPLLNQLGWNIGGQQIPSSLYNPLLRPAECWRSFLMSMGMFNSSQFRSGINAQSYHHLVSGGTATTAGGGQQNSQDQYWKDTLSSVLFQSTFFVGESLESVAGRSRLLSGMDLTFQKLNLVLGLSAPNSNACNVYVTGLLDTITIIDVQSGEVVTIV